MSLDDNSFPPPSQNTDPHLIFFDFSSSVNPDPFLDLVIGTFRPSVLIEDCDGFLAMERSLEGAPCFDIFYMYEAVSICHHIGHHMTFTILLDESHEIVCRSLFCSALDPDLLNHCLEPGFPDDVHPNVKAHLMLEVEQKQRKQHLASLKKQRVDSQIKSHKEFFDRVRNQLNKGEQLSNPATDLLQDPNPFEAPNSFVYLQDDGEQHPNSTSLDLEPIWKPFEILLLDEHGETCLDDNGEPITVIAKDPNSLNFNDHEERANTLQDLQYRVVYDRPSHLMKKNNEKQHYDFDQDNHDDQDSAYDNLLPYNEVVGYIYEEVPDATGKYWQFRKILGIHHDPHDHQDNASHGLHFWYRWTSICHLSLASLCSLPPFDGEFWLIRLSYEQRPKKTNNSNSNDIINCNKRLVRQPRTKSSNKKAAIPFLCQQQQGWMLNNTRRCKKAAI